MLSRISYKAGGYKVVPLYLIICFLRPMTGPSLIEFLPHWHGSSCAMHMSPVLKRSKGIPSTPKRGDGNFTRFSRINRIIHFIEKFNNDQIGMMVTPDAIFTFSK